MAVAGRIPVKVSGENGAINIGDLVAASSLEGHGMKSTATGRVLGVALEAFQAETATSTGKILVLVNPHWYYTNDVETLQGGGSGDMEMNNFTFDESLTTVIQVGTLVANNIYTLSLTVGTEEKPGGITLYDVQTKKPYCVLIENGDLIRYPGKCEDNYLVNPAAAPFAESATAAEPPATGAQTASETADNTTTTDVTTTDATTTDETATTSDTTMTDTTTTDATTTEPTAASADETATTTDTVSATEETATVSETGPTPPP